MRLARRTLLLGSAAILATRAARADAADLLARIARARANVRTLRGPFEQTRTIGLLTTRVKSHGTLTLVRPDRLRWQLDPPDSVTFWMTPEGLAYESARGRGRLPRNAASGTAAALDDLRTVLAGDLSKLSERWDLRVVRDDAGGAAIEANARPAAVTPIRALRLDLAADRVRPTRIVLVEGPRDRTEIVFGDLAVDAPVEERSMRPP